MMNRLVVIAFIVTFISCKNPTTPGVYVLNMHDAHDTIFVNSNNTFVQHVVINSKSYFNRGTWNYNDEFIQFDDFIWYVKGYGPDDFSKVNWLASKSISMMGESKLVVDADLEYRYVKQ